MAGLSNDQEADPSSALSTYRRVLGAILLAPDTTRPAARSFGERRILLGRAGRKLHALLVPAPRSSALEDRCDAGEIASLRVDDEGPPRGSGNDRGRSAPIGKQTEALARAL